MHFTFCIYWKKAQVHIPSILRKVSLSSQEYFISHGSSLSSLCNFHNFLDMVEDRGMILLDQEGKRLQDQTLTIHQTISLECKTLFPTMQVMFKPFLIIHIHIKIIVDSHKGQCHKKKPILGILSIQIHFPNLIFSACQAKVK